MWNKFLWISTECTGKLAQFVQSKQTEEETEHALRNVQTKKPSSLLCRGACGVCRCAHVSTCASLYRCDQQACCTYGSVLVMFKVILAGASFIKHDLQYDLMRKPRLSSSLLNLPLMWKWSSLCQWVPCWFCRGITVWPVVNFSFMNNVTGMIH